MERAYIGNRRSCGEIARDIGCTEANVIFWLRKHDIPRRTIAEARAVKHWGATGVANPMFGKTGALNPRFVDGGSPERQKMYARCEGKEFIRAILARDGFRCRRCSSKSTGPRTLHVHHLRPWAGNPTLRFDPLNVVTLCQRCHHWVHSKSNTGKEFIA